eukprot:4406550-Pyramimonas_sp.AAC.1
MSAAGQESGGQGADQRTGATPPLHSYPTILRYPCIFSAGPTSSLSPRPHHILFLTRCSSSLHFH